MSTARRVAAVMACVMTMSAASALVPAKPADAQAISPCFRGKPEGWEVIEEASSKPGENPLCNYRVTRKQQVKDENGKTSTVEFVSGTAITIEYYCSSDEGVKAFVGKTSPRKTETVRSGNKVVIEEGPAAKNPENPHSSGVTSGFFDIEFQLFEKEWWLINNQTVATIVVLTNEKGVVEESKRFGVSLVEPQARTVAFQGAPEKEGCTIPTTGGGGAGGGKGGGGGVPTGVIITGGVVIIGGVVVWRRRQGRTPTRPPSIATAGTPPNCLKDAQAYERARDSLLTLREAEQDLTEQLRRAETIHANNIMKAWMAASVDLGMAAGSVGQQIHEWARRKPPLSALGQLDTWHPPSSISAKMSEMLRKAEAALEAARGRIQTIMNEIEQIAGVLENGKRVIMETAKENLEVLQNRLRNLEQRLPAAEEARRLYDAADEAWYGAGGVGKAKTIASNAALNDFNRASSSLKAAEEALAHAGTQAESRLGYQEALKTLRSNEGELAEIRREIEMLRGRTDKEGLEILAREQRRLARYEEMVRSAKEEAARIAQEVNEAVQAEVDRVTQLRSEVSDLSKKWEGLKAECNAAEGNIARLNQEALKYNDVTAGSVAAARNDVANAQRAVEAASQGDPRVAAQLEAKQAELMSAETDLSLAEAYRDGVRNQIDLDAVRAARGAASGGDNSAANAIANVVKHPLNALGEIIFGVGQSPEEIKLILRQGQENVNLLGARLRAVERLAEARKSEAEGLRGKFDRCVAANQPGQGADKEPERAPA